MSSTKFLAIVPQTVQSGNKITINVTVLPNAEEFSINFANEPCVNPQNITYHFKWMLTENIIVENYKMNGDWIDHKETEYNKIDGNVIGLEFAFNEDGIYVYLTDGEGYNRITYFEPQFDISQIRSVQVWGDVDKVNTLTFQYS